MSFVPLTSAWGRDGSVAVLVSSLEDAGFHPVIECDPRGWMHFYSWPLGSSSPITIWIPDDEQGEALEFIAAAALPVPEESNGSDGIYGYVSRHRRLIYVVWAFGLVGIAGWIVLAAWRLTASRVARTEGR